MVTGLFVVSCENNSSMVTKMPLGQVWFGWPVAATTQTWPWSPLVMTIADPPNSVKTPSLWLEETSGREYGHVT
jgi:hypothetical protein